MIQEQKQKIVEETKNPLFSKFKKIKEKALSFNEEIKLKNKEFKEMSVAKKRVAIAKDALKQIKLRNFIVETGTYCDVDIKKDLSGNLKKILQTEQCTVCAKGALFAADILKRGNYNFNDNNALPLWFSAKESQTTERLKGIFSTKQLDLMEIAFEGYYEDEAAYNFFSKYKDNEERLIAILENVIKNEGTFKP